MPIDPTGTKPEPTAQAEEPPRLNMRCKRDKCTSIEAYEVKMPGVSDGQHMYRCVKCGMTWGVNLGGSVNF